MPRRLRSVEGARGVAALGVLIFHVGNTPNTYGSFAGATQRYLWLGVPLFFLLSGFLLFGPYARAIIRGSAWPSARRYASARFLRIGPAYWVVLTFTIIETSSLIVMPPMGVFDQQLLPVAAAALAAFLWVNALARRSSLLVPLAASAVAAFLLATHADVIWRGFANYSLIFLPLRMRGEVTVAWTLCIEIAFYATLPLFALAIRRATRSIRLDSHRAAVTVLFLLPAFPISYLYSEHLDRLPIWLPGYLDEFAIGMLLAVAFELRSTVSPWASRAMLAGAAVFLLAGHSLYTFGPTAPFSRGSGVLYARLMEVGFAFILASVLMRDERTVLGRLLSSRLLVAAGTISYGIYLWHMVFIQRFGETALWTNEWVALALVLPATVAVATASWFFVEKPSLGWRNRLAALRFGRIANRERALAAATAAKIPSEAAPSV